MSSRRRRRNRSSQSQRAAGKRGRGKLWGWSFLAVLGLLLVGTVFAYNAIRSYLRSDDFREMLGEKAGGNLRGEAEFQPFVWDGWDFTTDKFEFTGEAGIQKLEARKIEASVDFGAVWSGVYRIEDVSLRELEIHGDFRKQEGRASEFSVVNERSSKDKKSPGFFAKFLPSKLEVSRVEIDSIQGSVLTKDGSWTWEDASAKIEPGSAEGIYDVSLRDAEISTPLGLVNSLDLIEARGRYSGDRFFLLSSKFDALKKARIEITGDFGKNPEPWQLEGTVSNARIEEVIAEDWSQKLMGPLEAEFEVAGQGDEDALVTGQLRIPNGILTALPVLDRIAAYANTIRFRRLVLSDARLDFSKKGDFLELKNIHLASEGLVRLEGSMKLEGEIIRDGQFRLGITPGTLAHLPGAETKVFRQGEGGLLWTPVRVSGSLSNPQEDLSERLIQAAGERMFEMVPETGQWALKYGGQMVGEATREILSDQGVVLGAGKGLLGQATSVLRDTTGIDGSGAVEAGSDVLGEGADVIDQGVGKLFDLFGSPIEDRE